MNVQMEDLAKAFTRGVPASEPASEPEAEPAMPADALPKEGKSADATPGVVDPLQWWNALTQQFQQIAQTAMHDAGEMKMPSAAVTPSAQSPATPKTATSKAAAKKAAPRKTAKTKTAAAPRTRSR
jgi:hypothetical protein